MSKNETSGQESSESIDEKRAQYERMQFTVCPNGYVNVCNQSHNDDGNHTYSVEVSERSATGCSCPHYQHRSPEGGCKHMIAVEQSPIVVSSASAASETREVMTDGGTGDDRFLPPEHPEHVPEDEDEDDSDGRDRPTRSEHADFGGGEASGMDDLGAPDVDHEDDEQAGSGLGTVTGWETGSYETPEDEDVDETPL